MNFVASPLTMRPARPGDVDLEHDVSRTTTTDALLGLLSLGAMTGYEVRELIERSIGNFWSESFGQIYPALKRLVGDGLAEMEERNEEGRPRRKLYRLTAAGRDRLRAWLGSPAQPRVPRNDLLLKVFFGDQRGPEDTAAHLHRCLEEQRQLRSRYMAIEHTLTTEEGGHPAMPYWRLTARYGLRQSEALIRWAEEGLTELEGPGLKQNAK